MKKTLLTLAIVAAYCGSYAQTNDYIQNQNSGAQTANSWINGNSIINGNLGVGTTSGTASANIHSASTTEQLRLQNGPSGNNYTSFLQDANGNFSINNNGTYNMTLFSQYGINLNSNVGGGAVSINGGGAGLAALKIGMATNSLGYLSVGSGGMSIQGGNNTQTTITMSGGNPSAMITGGIGYNGTSIPFYITGSNPVTQSNGGSLYLYPGVGNGSGTTNGNLILGYNGTAAIGNVGIGTATPNASLEVSGTTYLGNINSSSQNSQGVKVFTGNSANVSQGVDVIRGTGWTNVATLFGFHLMSDQNGLYRGAIGVNNVSDQSNPFTEQMSFLINGNVGIGTKMPDQLLTVKGTIHAQQVNIDLSVPGPDYVFAKNYKLRSLAEVNRYIALHKHLPEIPSGKSMEKNGINVNEFNMKMLQKVEELTLYLIDKDKEISEQRRQIADQQNVNQQQQKQLADQQKFNQSLQQQVNELAKQIKHKK